MESNTSPKLLDRIRQKIRYLHYSNKTEQAYLMKYIPVFPPKGQPAVVQICQWIKRYILFHYKTHPRGLVEIEISAFLTHLAVNKNVSASTQNQVLSALLFLYQHVLCKLF
jgi:hypothetical protein